MVKKFLTNQQTFFLRILAFLLFVSASIYITFPLVFHLADFANGEYVLSWIFNWNIHSFLTGNIHNIFNANIFFPYPNTLAYSDGLFTSSIIALPFFLLLHEPMIPANITFLTSLIFLGFCCYLLSYFLTKNFFASLLSGVLVIFSPTVLDKRVHLQILSIWWVPLSIYFFLKYFKTEKYRYFFLTLLCFYLQTINNFMAGYFIVFSCGLITFFECAKNKRLKVFFTKKNIFSLLITLILIIPIVVPYILVSQQLHFVRDIREAIHLSLQPEDLVVGNEYTRLQQLLLSLQNQSSYTANAELKPGYIGFLFTLLTAGVTIYWFLNRKKSPKYLGIFLCIAYFALLLSFGPAMHLGRKTIHHPFLVPLPYALFYYILPGFQGFRNAARFEMLFVISCAVAVAISISSFLKQQPKIISLLIAIVLFIGVIGEYNFPMQFQKAPTFKQFPAVYRWLTKSTAPSAVILELPIYNWDNNPFGDNREVLREYYSIIHFRKLVSGGSGFSPLLWQQFAIDIYATFPSNKAIQAIKRYGAQYIILHKDEFDILHTIGYLYREQKILDGKAVIDSLSGNSAVKLITQQGKDYVYKIQ